jgi:hypothetical protein
MKCEKNFYPFLAFAVLLFLTSCSSTQFLSLWKDQTYQRHAEKIMVVGLSQGLADRRLFEDEFVRDVKNHGAEAIASYTVLQDASLTDSNAIDTRAEGMGADAVLISRVTGTQAEDVLFASPVVPHEFTDIYVNIQTNLYEVKTHRLLWTASTKTWVRAGFLDKYGIRSLVKAIIKKMSQEGLLRPDHSGLHT